MSKTFWDYFVLAYILVASVTPVWILLQPRDYLNSFLLYGMADAKAGAAHDGQVPPLKQIVHRADRAIGAVFNGQHSKLA